MSTLREKSIEFNFTPIEPGNKIGSTIYFRGWIENISDNSNSSWNENKNIGRADPKFMYSSYSRSINVDFKTAALNKGEEQLWIDAINSLKGMTTPVYNNIHGYNGVMCKIKIGKLIDEIGIIESVGVTVFSEADWINGIPMVFDIGVQFRVVGFRRPQYGSGRGDFGSRREYGRGIRQ